MTACGPDGFKLGTVGRATPGMEVTLADDGEILIRGPVNTPGYYSRRTPRAPTSTRTGGSTAVTSAPWTTTASSRWWTARRTIITSNGKNIAPSNIENYLKESPIVGHAMAVGDNKPYVVAVLTLDGEIAPVVAERMGVGFTDLADLAAKPEIRALAQDAVDKANARLSRPEQIKAFELLPVEWTAESEELDPTLKLKRRGEHQVRRRAGPLVHLTWANSSGSGRRRLISG